MTSQRKTEANRRNAEKSTGPRTAAGKSRSRYNAWRHGHRASTLIGPTETLEQFMGHCRLFFKDLRPWDARTCELVFKMAADQWRLDRGGHYEVQVLASALPLSEKLRRLDCLTWYESRLTARSERCLRELDRRLKAALKKPMPRPSAAERAGVEAHMLRTLIQILGSFVQKQTKLVAFPQHAPPMVGYRGQDVIIRWLHEGG
jgi:hypothetical protein